MALKPVEKRQYADIVGPCSHNHEDTCAEYWRRVAAGSLETVDTLRAENARLQDQVGEHMQRRAEAEEEARRLQMCEGMARDMAVERDGLQERVEEAERHDCGYALQRTLEIAERQMALAKVRGEALEKYGTHSSGCLAKGWKRGDNEYRCTCGLDDAIAMTPEEARR